MRICIPLKGQYIRLNEPIHYDFEWSSQDNGDFAWLHREIVWRIFGLPVNGVSRRNYHITFPAGLVLKVVNFSHHYSAKRDRIKLSLPKKKNDRTVLKQVLPTAAVMGSRWAWFPILMLQGIDVDLITETPS